MISLLSNDRIYDQHCDCTAVVKFSLCWLQWTGHLIKILEGDPTWKSIKVVSMVRDAEIVPFVHEVIALKFVESNELDALHAIRECLKLTIVAGPKLTPVATLR